MTQYLGIAGQVPSGGGLFGTTSKFAGELFDLRLGIGFETGENRLQLLDSPATMGVEGQTWALGGNTELIRPLVIGAMTSVKAMGLPRQVSCVKFIYKSYLYGITNTILNPKTIFY